MMPKNRVTPVFNSQRIIGKNVLINAMRDKFIQASKDEEARLKTLDVSVENATLIEAEGDIQNLTRSIHELLELTECNFIPKMNTLHELLNSLEVVDWLDDAERGAIERFNIALKEFVISAEELNLENTIHDDDSIFNMAQRLSDKINGPAFKQYFQAMAAMAVFLSEITKLEAKHKEKMLQFTTDKLKTLTENPYNYMAVVKQNRIDSYATQPMQMTMRYKDLYERILKYTSRAISANPLNDETNTILPSVTKASKFCADRAQLTNKLTDVYETNTQEAKTSGAHEKPVKTTNNPLIALGAVIQRLFKKDERAAPAEKIPQTAQPSPTKTVDHTSGKTSKEQLAPREIITEPRRKPSQKEEAFFEILSPTGTVNHKRRSSGIEQSSETTSKDTATADSEEIKLKTIQ